MTVVQQDPEARTINDEGDQDGLQYRATERNSSMSISRFQTYLLMHLKLEGTFSFTSSSDNLEVPSVIDRYRQARA